MDNELTVFTACLFAGRVDSFALCVMGGNGTAAAFLSDHPSLISQDNM